MPQREWTGSVARLPEAIRALAISLADDANEESHAALRSRVSDHAYTLSEWADAVEQLYLRADAPAGSNTRYTNAQGAAIVRRITPQTTSVLVQPRPFDLPDGFLLVQYEDRHAPTRFTCGIALDGSVSS